MHEKPLVSIITASHNGSRYLAQAIESVIAQDYPNKEYLIINDASKDNTAEIIEKYCNQYPWIHSITNETNQERSRSRNTGITAAKGKYIAFLDDDDLFNSPEKLSQQVTYLEKNPNCSLLGTDVEIIDEEGEKLNKFIWIREDSKTLKNNFLKSNQFIFSTVMAKKADLIKV